MTPPPSEAINEIISAAADTLMSDTIKALTRGAAFSCIEGQEHAAATLGVGLNFNLVNSYAMAKVADYRNSLVKDGGSVINGKLKPWLTDMIAADRQAVSDAIMQVVSKEGGTTFRDIRKSLDTVFTQQEHNSSLVAYQETRRLLNDGTFDRWQDEGISRGIFRHLAGQRDPRPEHEAMDGKEVDINDPEIRAMLNDYNCHCGVEPLLPGTTAAAGGD
jgi:SPP1 gp7 family putative phage head morphogenesis protein